MCARSGWFASGSPVGRFTEMVAFTVSPAPYALRTNSSFFLMRGGSYALTTSGRVWVWPSNAVTRSVYSPPCTWPGSTKSLRAVPSSARSRFLSTAAPLGDTSSTE